MSEDALLSPQQSTAGTPTVARDAASGAELKQIALSVTWQLSRAALVDFPTGAIAALSAAVLIYFRIHSAWLIFAGGLVGLVATRWLGG